MTLAAVLHKIASRLSVKLVIAYLVACHIAIACSSRDDGSDEKRADLVPPPSAVSDIRVDMSSEDSCVQISTQPVVCSSDVYISHNDSSNFTVGIIDYELHLAMIWLPPRWESDIDSNRSYLIAEDGGRFSLRADETNSVMFASLPEDNRVIGLSVNGQDCEHRAAKDGVLSVASVFFCP